MAGASIQDEFPGILDKPLDKLGHYVYNMFN